MKKLITVIAILACTACTDPQGAKETLESSGYTDIRTKGYAWFACGEHDFYATKFRAKNPLGVKTNGVVCSGILKNGTVRH